jgi:hypothetical protein
MLACVHRGLRSSQQWKKMLYLRSTDNIRQVLEVTYFKVLQSWYFSLLEGKVKEYRRKEGRLRSSYERDMGWIRIERNNFCLILTDVINTTHCLLSLISINRIPNIYVQVYNGCFTKYIVRVTLHHYVYVCKITELIFRVHLFFFLFWKKILSYVFK